MESYMIQHKLFKDVVINHPHKPKDSISSFPKKLYRRIVGILNHKKIIKPINNTARDNSSIIVCVDEIEEIEDDGIILSEFVAKNEQRPSIIPSSTTHIMSTFSPSVKIPRTPPIEECIDVCEITRVHHQFSYGKGAFKNVIPLIPKPKTKLELEYNNNICVDIYTPGFVKNPTLNKISTRFMSAIQIHKST